MTDNDFWSRLRDTGWKPDINLTPPRPPVNGQSFSDRMLDRQHVKPGDQFDMRGWLRGEGPHEVVFEHDTPPVATQGGYGNAALPGSDRLIDKKPPEKP